MASVANDLARLAIRSEEDDCLEIDSADPDLSLSYDFCFVGSFLTTSVIHFVAMRSTLANVWHPVGGISISDLGEGRYLFCLYLAADADRIESGGPWNFNNHLLILHRLLEGEDPNQVPLTHLNFWVLVHNLSHGFISEKVARSLGNFLGSFLEYDTMATSLGYRGIITIRVKIDIRIPLKRRKKLRLANGSDHYVRFDYELLTLFCFICGLLGHGESFCPIRASVDLADIVMEWDVSLRAPPRRRSQPESIWLREAAPVESLPRLMPVQGRRGNVINSSTANPANLGGVLNSGKSKESWSGVIAMHNLGGTISGPTTGPSVIGAPYAQDVLMTTEEENTPMEHVDGLKRPRVQSLSPGVSNLSDSNGSPSNSSADLPAQVRRSS